MTRQFNQKAIIDQAGKLAWDTSSGYRQTLIEFANEIQDDIASKLPASIFKFRMKKTIPTAQSIVDLNAQIPTQPTAVIASGGSLTDGSTYKVYVTFVIYDEDLRDYIESEPSPVSAACVADATNKTISLTNLDVLDGGTAVVPKDIYRNLYVATLASGETSYAEPFFHSHIKNNTATTASITSEPTSTVTPPSASEISMISEDEPFFDASNSFLQKRSMNLIRRSTVTDQTSTTPYAFDYVGPTKIFIYPQLSSSATVNQRTISYHVYRRPHEFFYDVDRPVDLPIDFRSVLLQGIVYRVYYQRDRDGKVSEFQKYERMRDDVINRLTRQRGGPGVVHDTLGDVDGWSI